MIKPNDKKNILISGIFVSVLFAVVVATVFMLNKENPIFRNDIIIIGKVSSAQNLKSGAAIQLRGIKVGSVSEINIQDLKTIEILMAIDKKYSKWIKKDATVSFKTQGVLGDKFLEISGGSSEAQNILDNGFIEVDESSQIDQIINKSEDVMVVAASLLKKLDKLIAVVEAKKITNIINSLEKFGDNNAEITKTVKNLNQSSISLNKITKQIEAGPGTMHSLIYDQGLHEDVRSLLGGANRSKLLKFFIRESILKNEAESPKKK